jgi:hypothetical protein
MAFINAKPGTVNNKSHREVELELALEATFHRLQRNLSMTPGNALASFGF